MICFGYRTPSAALHYLTKRRGPYRWWGLTIGRYFIGVMVHTKLPRLTPTESEARP